MHSCTVIIPLALQAALHTACRAAQPHSPTPIPETQRPRSSFLHPQAPWPLHPYARDLPIPVSNTSNLLTWQTGVSEPVEPLIRLHSHIPRRRYNGRLSTSPPPNITHAEGTLLLSVAFGSSPRNQPSTPAAPLHRPSVAHGHLVLRPGPSVVHPHPKDPDPPRLSGEVVPHPPTRRTAEAPGGVEILRRTPRICSHHRDTLRAPVGTLPTTRPRASYLQNGTPTPSICTSAPDSRGTQPTHLNQLPLILTSSTKLGPRSPILRSSQRIALSSRQELPLASASTPWTVQRTAQDHRKRRY
ncbi:unnamed protein product [Cutaneotrichosporon oleaginosum]